MPLNVFSVSHIAIWGQEGLLEDNEEMERNFKTIFLGIFRTFRDSKCWILKLCLILLS